MRQHAAPGFRLECRAVGAGLSPRRVVLAVDDDPGVRGAYQVIFEPDYELLLSPDAAGAMALLGQRAIDVMLLDILMPGLGGLAVLDRMQHVPRAPKVVVVSACDDSRTAVMALRLGAREYVPKPFDPDELELIVRCLAEGQTIPVRHPDAPPPTLANVLIVSSHVGLRASLAVVLRSRCHVDCVPHLRAASGILSRSLPDVIVLDEAPDVGEREPLARMRE
jgi:DNA-binding NarL/FixJ family response regulator